MQGVIGITAQQVDALFKLALHDKGLLITAFGAGQVADRAGDDADRVAALNQAASQFVVARAAGFVQCCKSLVDEEYMHGSGIRKNKKRAEFYIILAGHCQCA